MIHDGHFHPNTAPVPLFENAGSVRMSGDIGYDHLSDLQVAISPIEHIGLIGSGSWASGENFHRYFEGGFGYYFSPFTLKNDSIKTEAFVGYGSGTANGVLTNANNIIFWPEVTDRKIYANYCQYYIQFNWAVCDKIPISRDIQSTEIMIDYGTIIRISRTKFSNFKKDGQVLNLTPMEGSFIQMAAFCTVGIKGVGVTGQTGILYGLSNQDSSPTYAPFYITIGLNIRLW